MPPASQVVYAFEVSVNGSPLPQESAVVVIAVTVDNSLNLPDLAVVELSDPGGMLMGASGLRIGAELEVKVRDGSGPALAIFKGEVTALEVDFDGGVNRTVVRAYDKSHRLLRGRRTKAWVNVTYTDIVRQLAQDANVPLGQIDSTATVHSQVTQAAVEDWHFMRRLADEVGYHLAVVDGKLEMTKPKPPPEAAKQSLTSTDRLAYAVGDDGLLRLRAVLTSAGQVPSTEVRGWDPKTKEAVVASSPAAAADAKVSSTPAGLAGLFGARPFSAPRSPLQANGDVTALAGAISGHIAGAFVDLEAEVVGNPKLRPGAVIDVGGVGKPLQGAYTVSSTRHVYDHLGYRTRVVVSDRQDRSLLGLVGAAEPAPAVGQMPGVAPAIVTNIEDPDGKCRVKLKFPWLDDTYVSDWARTVQPGAGSERGFEILPEVGDEVLVAFERGEIGSPVVIGGLHNGVDAPPRPNAQVVTGGLVTKRLFRSRTGHTVLIDDTEGPQGGITLFTGDSQTKVVLNMGDNGITIESTKPVLMKSSSTVSVEAGADLSLKADGAVSIQGATVKVQAEGPVQVQGAIIKLN